MDQESDDPGTNRAKLAGKTEILCFCPKCNSVTSSGNRKPKLSYNLDRGIYHCFQCGFKGQDNENQTLLQSLEKTSIRVFSDKTANFSLLFHSFPVNHAVLEAFLQKRLPGYKGAHVRYDPKTDRIAIATTDFEGNITGIKYREHKTSPIDTEQKRYSSETGSQHEGFWLSGSNSDKLLIVEGEIDAITAQLCGFDGWVLAAQTNQLKASQLSLINKFANLFVLPDRDLGGEQFLNSVQELLCKRQVSVLKLKSGSFKDLNELLQGEGFDACSEFVRRETQTEFERNIKSISNIDEELISFLANERNVIGHSTGWLCLDQVFGGGLRKNEITVVNAFAKTGKTSFVTNLIHNLAKNNAKSLVLSFEMDPATTLFPALFNIAAKTDVTLFKREVEIRDALSVIREAKPYLKNITALKHQGYAEWKSIDLGVRAQFKKEPFQFLVIDHTAFLLEDPVDASLNQLLAQNLRRLCSDLQIHLIVVVQAPKTKDGLSIQTSYGGMAWAMHADNFLLLERDKEDLMRLHVKLAAARSPKAQAGGSPVILIYDRDIQTLSETQTLSESGH